MYKSNIASSYSAGLNSENNGSIATEGKDKERQLDSKHNLRVEGDEIMVDVMAYKSNPILKDTDFDGVWDGIGKEQAEELARNRGVEVKSLTSLAYMMLYIERLTR